MGDCGNDKNFHGRFLFELASMDQIGGEIKSKHDNEGYLCSFLQTS